MTIGQTRIDPRLLISKTLLVSYLKENGENNRVLLQIRENQRKQFGRELIWRYPIADDKHTGSYIIAVKEGFVRLPYDVIGLEDWEYYDLTDLVLLSAEAVEILINDWNLFSDELLSVLTDIHDILGGN